MAKILVFMYFDLIDIHDTNYKSVEYLESLTH